MTRAALLSLTIWICVAVTFGSNPATVAQERRMVLKGDVVSPAYEGWWPNADGTFKLFFGYMNTNWQQQFDIPIGPRNYFSVVEAGDLNDLELDGYDDDASDKKILRNVKEQGDAWFNTGDLLKQIDVGFAFKIPHYQFVDRIGDTYRWRSENVSTNEVGEILNEHSQIEISNVYGVSVPGTEGKAGMAAVTLPKDCQFDIKSFSDYVFKNLPHFARPVFLRIQEAHETTGTFKLLKGDLKKQGYNPDLMGSDKLFVLMPKTELYLELNDEKYQSIVNASAGF